MDRGAKLTAEQEAMVASCLALDAAWVTGADGENAALLKSWCDAGLFTMVAPPGGSSSLKAYRITALGRAALQSKSP